jgi:hypothetical protein
MNDFNFENAEGAETRTRKLNLLEEEVDVLQLRGSLDYETTEQDTGTKWIDGRPIYQKTLSFGAVGTGEQTVPHGIAGLDVILDTEGFAVQANGVISTLPRLSSGTVSQDSIFFKRHDTTNIYGYVGTAFVTTTAITGGAVTIKYIKD